jgi:hypothetical protein
MYSWQNPIETSEIKEKLQFRGYYDSAFFSMKMYLRINEIKA